jgi:hypothetical protein
MRTPIGARGRASADIRALGGVLARLTPISGRKRVSGLQNEMNRIAETALADEPHPRFVQVSRMEERLQSAIAAEKGPRSSTGLPWPATIGAAACVGLAATACYILLERSHRAEMAESQTRIAAAETQARTHETEAKRLLDLWRADLDTRSEVSDRLRYSNKRGVVPDLLLAFSTYEQMRWPIGIDQSFIEYRLSFQRDRVDAGRRFVDEAHARSEENNIEVMLTEVMLSTWEFEVGEIAAAADTLRRVVPRLRQVCAETDPLMIGAEQLLTYVSDLANHNTAVAHLHYQDWVKRIIDICVSAQSKVEGPYGEQYKFLPERLNDEENYERDMAYTRKIKERMRAQGLQVGPPPEGE